eukprot:TRINITY_DN3569_c0_g2_i4.p2 TRINITY_DN3569_c0_g2~~TRINITY_DN3569_c0_g2_i4.p2  ORF type:complete len:205 (-),score=75.47 TRINITY_DN3569_c0_g2_i4:285-899(-)
MDKVQVTVSNASNPKKIPEALFIEDVENFVNKHGVQKIMESLQEVYSKYKLMESQLQRQKESMKQKIPEIKRALDIIEFLEKKQDEEMNLDFLLADTIWAKGKINKGTQKVNLWLGANVLVEYSFDEAKTLLRKNLDNASINLKTFVDDLTFLKDQITTCEVNIARVYNQNVKIIQESKRKELETGAKQNLSCPVFLQKIDISM